MNKISLHDEINKKRQAIHREKEREIQYCRKKIPHLINSFLYQVNISGFFSVIYAQL